MVTVDCHDIDPYWIEEFLVLFEIDRNDVIATLRCQTDSRLAVATVNGYRAVGFLETNDLIAGQRTAIPATVELKPALLVEETVYV